MAKRTLEVDIRANNQKLKQGLDDSKRQVGGFESAVKKAGVALIGAFAAQKVVSGIKSMITNLTQTADRLNDLQDMTGITTDKLQEYEYVARIAGVNTEALTQASLGLTRRLAGATTEASPLNIALKQLGVESKTASGELRGGGDILDDLIGKLADMDNQTERNVLGAQVFGGAWKDMAPILAMGAAGIDKVRQEARDLGIIMDKETIAKANELRISQERLSAVSQSLGRELTMMFVPALIKLAEAAAEGVRELNLLAKGFRALNSDENLSWWDKLKTKMQVVFGAASGNFSMLAKGAAQMAESTTKYNEQLEEQAVLQAASTTEAIKGLGDIQKLQQQIADEKQRYIEANTESERVAATIRIKQLEEELELIERIARTRALVAMTGIGAPTKAGGIGAGGLSIDQPGLMGPDIKDDATITYLEEVAAAQDAAAESMRNWQDTALTASAAIGGALGSMATKGKKSVSEIIKQSLAQTIAYLMPSIVKTLGFPAAIPALIAAPALVSLMFNKIPAFAGGGRVTEPTLAMFGEYAGASSNPEYALRQDQLIGLMQKATPQGEMRVRWVNAGPDMLGFIDEANRRYR